MDYLCPSIFPCITLPSFKHCTYYKVLTGICIYPFISRLTRSSLFLKVFCSCFCVPLTKPLWSASAKRISNAPVLPALNHLTSPSQPLFKTKAPQFWWIYFIVSALPPLELSSHSPQRWPHPHLLPLSNLFRPLPSTLLSLSSLQLKYPYSTIPTSFHAPS